MLALAVERHRQGRLDEAGALYERVLALDPRAAQAWHLLGRVRHARDDAEGALAAIDRALRLRPDEAAAHASRCAVLISLGRLSDAEAAGRRAVALASQDPEARNVLGAALLSAGQAGQAVALFREAVALRPSYAEAHNNLGSALRALDQPAAAEAALREAVRLRPGYASALANLGLVLQDQGRFEDALDAFDRAVAAAPGHATARGNRAMLLLLLGRLSEGFAEYEWRWRMPGFATPAREFAQPAWDGGPLHGRTLLVHAEQGQGSAVQFVRFLGLAAARGARVVLECQRPLLRLFRQSLLAPAGPLADVVVKGEPLPGFDAHVPLLSLPHRLGTTLQTLPAAVRYVRADPAEAAAWRQRLAAWPAPRVGVVWAGNPEHENDRRRSMPAALLCGVANGAVAGAGGTVFSLQVPAPAGGTAGLGFPEIVDLSGRLHDFADTAAAVVNLDLVLSVDTAVAHLAGALARPVWLLLPHVPDWRWLLGRDDSPWYPTMRLFRQRAPGDWAEAAERACEALRRWVGERGSGG